MRFNRHGIALLLSVTVIGILVVPSKATADSISYSLISPSLLESTFKPGGNLDFTFSLITNNSKTEPVYCYIDGFLNAFEATLISGQNNNGRFRCQAAIPARPMELRSSGTYPLDVLVVYFDEFGKQELRETFGYINFAVSLPATISITNISVNKTSLNAGGQLTVAFDMRSSNLTPALVQNNSVMIYKNDLGDCDDGDCPSAPASLISGDVSNGSWRATINIPATIISGSYTPVVIFGSLKGVSGNIGTSPTKVAISGQIEPAKPLPATISITNISVNKTSLNAGGQLTVAFDMRSSNLTPALVQNNSVMIYKNDLGDCDDGDCPSAPASLISGDVSNGSWRATINIPATIISGSYTPVVIFGSLKGVSGNIGTSPTKVAISGQIEPAIPSSNNAFLTTATVSATSSLSSDLIGDSLPYQASSVPVARIFIPQGSGTVIASVTGPGLLSSTSLYAAGRVLILNRSLTSVMNLYLFPDGTQGRSTISITVSGQANIKTINFGNFGGVSPTPTAKPTISPKPTTSENPKTLATPTSTAKPTISPKPTTSENPKTLTTPTPAIKKSLTINCSNGKSTKKVTGTNPKCPSGYKKT